MAFIRRSVPLAVIEEALEGKDILRKSNLTKTKSYSKVYDNRGQIVPDQAQLKWLALGCVSYAPPSVKNGTKLINSFARKEMIDASLYNILNHNI